LLSFVVLLGISSGFNPVQKSQAAAASVTYVATYNNIGVEVNFGSTYVPPTGSVITMSIRKSGIGDYRLIHPLTQITTAAPIIFAGSAFGLTADTSYDIKLQSPILDSGQYVISPPATTRKDAAPTANGTTYHVSTSGNDANNGTSQATAFRTLAKALSVAQANNTILLYDGVYLEGDLSVPRSGNSETAAIIIKNAPGAKPILDGSDPNFSPNWTLYDSVNKVYSTPYTSYPYRTYMDGKLLFRYEQRADLQNQLGGVGPSSGYYVDGTNMYVRFPNGGTWTGHDVKVPSHTDGLRLDSKNYIMINGIEFRYYGLGQFNRGISLTHSKYIWIENCNFNSLVTGVSLKFDSNFNTIQNNTFTSAPLSSWNWTITKTSPYGYESGGFYIYAPEIPNTPNVGNVIRSNTFNDFFDGMQLFPNKSDGPTKNMDFHNNHISNISDDAIATDVFSVIREKLRFFRGNGARTCKDRDAAVRLVEDYIMYALPFLV
jgi:hypothetical protein